MLGVEAIEMLKVNLNACGVLSTGINDAPLGLRVCFRRDATDHSKRTALAFIRGVIFAYFPQGYGELIGNAVEVPPDWVIPLTGSPELLRGAREEALKKADELMCEVLGLHRIRVLAPPIVSAERNPDWER